ncbi:MAG: competence/damage-inducible protein A [Bacteroidota bacterium]
MQAEIISIGTELLLGEIVDTNAAFIARNLAELGIDLYYKTTVGDNLPRIVAELRRAWERSEIVITTGGLGPTQDDLTREGVAALLGEELVPRPEELAKMREFFARLGRSMSPNNERQAMFPASAEPLPNPEGTAPGLTVARGGRYLFALPGVPVEMERMLIREVLPRLRALTGVNPLFSRTLRLVGIGESVMAQEVADLIDGGRNPTVAPYAKRGETRLRLTARAADHKEAERLFAPVEAEIRRRLGRHVYGTDGDTLEAVVGRLLRDRGLTLATAESCTGGLVGHRLTNVPGSSAYYLGGVTAYDNRVKTGLLDVAEETLAARGAVSEETARAMAEGARKKLHADLGLSTTGIAGPGGGTEDKPVGLVYLGLAWEGGASVRRMVSNWDRVGNKEAAAQGALAFLWERLREMGSGSADMQGGYRPTMRR